MPNETTNTPILTLDSDAKLETAQSISDLTWHEIQNAYRTRRILAYHYITPTVLAAHFIINNLSYFYQTIVFVSASMP